MARKEYYKILGEIEETATFSEIRKAYKIQALKWHPDKFGSANSPAKTLKEAENKIREINEAYEILGDENKRRKYDGGESTSVEKYGCDHGDKVPNEEAAIGKVYLSGKLNEIHNKIRDFAVNYNSYKAEAERKGEELPIISDYHLIRAQKLLQIINSYYYPIYKKTGSWDKFKTEYVSVFKENGLIWMSGYTVSGWEKAVGQFREWIDFAREKIGLSKLTDGNIGLFKIKDGVASVEEYNKSFTKENNETIREYETLRGMIYDKPKYWQKYQAVDLTLLKEMDKKAIEAERESFRELWASDGESKIAEIKSFNESKLTKMKEVIRLMKNLVEKGENYKPPIEDTSAKDKKQAEAELSARKEIFGKNKAVSAELDRLIHEAKGVIRDYDELEAKIKEIDKYQGEEIYDNRQSEIQQLKSELIRINESNYREGVVKRIENKLKEVGKKEGDLTDKERKDLGKIKSGEITSLNDISKVENEIVARISKSGFLDILNNLIKEANELVENVAKGTADKLQKLRKGLYSFQFSSNIYCREILTQKNPEFQNALNQLENISYPENLQEEPSLFRPEVVITVSLISLLAIGTVLMIKKVRRK